MLESFNREFVKALSVQYDNSLLLNEILESLGTVIEYDLHDYETHQHALRVGEGCVIVGDRLGLEADTIQKLYYAGVLHDIGKITIPLTLLNKKDKLTDEEYDEVKEHAISGSRIVASLPGMTKLASWVRWHHEWWDGSGYPDGLAGEEIPVAVQILSILDMFDSMQTPRADRNPRAQEEVIELMKRESGLHFSPQMVDTVLTLVEEGLLEKGESKSEHFKELKAKYVDVPFHDYDTQFWQRSGISSLYPVLKLFAHVIDSKHTHTHGHSTRVSALSKLLGERMGLPHDEVLKAEIAGFLHDAGKVTIPMEILNKETELSEEEWAIIKKHTTKTFEIIGYSSTLREIAFIAACHHERYDGKGYPMQLAKNEVPLLSSPILLLLRTPTMRSPRRGPIILHVKRNMPIIS